MVGCTHRPSPKKCRMRTMRMLKGPMEGDRCQAQARRQTNTMADGQRLVCHTQQVRPRRCWSGQDRRPLLGASHSTGDRRQPRVPMTPETLVQAAHCTVRQAAHRHGRDRRGAGNWRSQPGDHWDRQENSGRLRVGQLRALYVLRDTPVTPPTCRACLSSWPSVVCSYMSSSSQRAVSGQL